MADSNKKTAATDLRQPTGPTNIGTEIIELAKKFERYRELIDRLKTRRSNLLASMNDSSFSTKKIRRITKVEMGLERLTTELTPAIEERLRIKRAELYSSITVSRVIATRDY